MENAARLFERIDAGEIDGFIAVTTITNIYYIVRDGFGGLTPKNHPIPSIPPRHDSCCSVMANALKQYVKIYV